MIYSNKLKEIREENSITQKDICKIIEIERGLYSQYENEYFIMPIKHLNILCNYFQVSLDYIFEFTNIQNYKNSKNEIDLKVSAKRLKELRKENKITQVKLASILNVSQATIAKYEKGKNIIATPFLYTICKKYKISADYLLGKIDAPKYLK